MDPWARQTQIPATQIPVFLANQIPILTPSQLGVLNLGISNPKIDPDQSANQNTSTHLRPPVQGAPLEPYFSIAGTSSITIRRVSRIMPSLDVDSLANQVALLSRGHFKNH